MCIKNSNLDDKIQGIFWLIFFPINFLLYIIFRSEWIVVLFIFITIIYTIFLRTYPRSRAKEWLRHTTNKQRLFKYIPEEHFIERNLQGILLMK